VTAITRARRCARHAFPAALTAAPANHSNGFGENGGRFKSATTDVRNETPGMAGVPRIDLTRATDAIEPAFS
jgi:hypothetical protein